jgi:hypothetical protein
MQNGQELHNISLLLNLGNTTLSTSQVFMSQSSLMQMDTPLQYAWEEICSLSKQS